MSKKQVSTNEIMVHKVILSSGKVVLLRDMQIKYQRMAMQAVGKRAEGNSALLGTMAVEEVIKSLIVQIDGQEVSAKDKEDLDSLFSFAEFKQVSQVVGKLMGGEESGEAQMESAFIGSK